MCSKKMSAEGKINHDEYLFLLRGGLPPANAKATNPSTDWINDNSWDQVINRFHSKFLQTLSHLLIDPRSGWV